MIRYSPKWLFVAQRGFTLVTAIFLVVVLAALGVFIVSVTGLQSASQTQDVQGVRAYQAARAGMEWGLFQVLDPNNSQLSAFATCNDADPLPVPMPACFAATSIGQGHASTLAGTLAGFTVTVQCTLAADTTEGNRRVVVYQIEATGCNQISGASCLTATPAQGYVERRLTTTLSKCRDSTASPPRCSCG